MKNNNKKLSNGLKQNISSGLKNKKLLFIFIVFFFVVSFSFVFAYQAPSTPEDDFYNENGSTNPNLRTCEQEGGTCIEWNKYLHLEYSIINASCGVQSTKQCTGQKASACTKKCVNIDSCGKPISGFCDGAGLNVCCDGVLESTLSAMELESKKITFIPEVGIPGFKSAEANGALLKNFLLALYNYLLYLSGIFAVIMIIIAGFQWVLAGGNQNKIGEAKNRIKNAIIGLVLISSSYLILSIINPDLINIKELKIETIKPIGFWGFDPKQYQIDRKKSLDENKKCTNNEDCSGSVRICAPRASNNPTQKICMNRSVDNGQCDEDADCFEGLMCTNYKCVIPPELNCSHGDTRTRCFFVLYNVNTPTGAPDAGWCNEKKCTPCLNRDAVCGNLPILTAIDLALSFKNGDAMCFDNSNMCGEIDTEELKNNKYFNELNDFYKQAPGGNCRYVANKSTDFLRYECGEPKN